MHKNPKPHTWVIALPLAILLMGTLTRWWYVQPEDAPDSMMAGFPLPFACDGWFTSLSLQLFVGEFLLDFSLYLLGVYLLLRFIRRIFPSPVFFRRVAPFLWTMALLTMAYWTFIFTYSEKVFKWKRDWNYQVLATGFHFAMSYPGRPNLIPSSPSKK